VESGQSADASLPARQGRPFALPCFACTPNKLPELIEGVLKKQNLKALAARLATKKEGKGSP